jgi:large subunit ribosomal protein L24
MARHVRKGDLVMVTSGSHKGKTGTIMRVISGDEPGSERVLIKGLNLRTKHLKPTPKAPQGGIITRESPLHISNVSPVDKNGKPTRVRFKQNADGSKVRLAATTGDTIGEPIRSADAKKDVKKSSPKVAKKG